MYARTWYLYRANDVEIQITIKFIGTGQEQVVCSLPLTPKEFKHFNDNFRKIKIKNVRLKNK
jgi:hypothetical protein